MQLLTRLPVSVSRLPDDVELGRSLLYYPLVGLLIGVLLAGANWLLAAHLPPMLLAALLLLFWVMLTGALHLDGLADVCDGLAARGSQERFLAIMKDSQVGAIGAVGLVLGLMLKWQALVAVPEEFKWQALLLFPALARFGQVLTLTGARHARQDGLGADFVQGSGKMTLLLAFATVAAVGHYLLGLRGVVALAAVCMFTIAGRIFFQHKLGGLTGDTIGCLSELNEILVLVVIAAAI